MRSSASPARSTEQVVKTVSQKSRLAVVLLCFFLGFLGIHRFYVGKVGTGILWLFTGGLVGIGVLVDFIMALAGSFTDKSGAFVSNWTN
jgi:TM2 domain-containing membrane protein YozV